MLSEVGISIDAPSGSQTCLGIFVVFVLRVLWLRYCTALANVPGPFLASITTFWKWHIVWKSEFPWTNADLHSKYGPLVRIGPNHVSASSPEAVHAIYIKNKGLQKSAIYSLLQPHFDGLPLHNVFSTQDVDYHTTLKRTVGALYAMSSIQGLEDNVDRVITALVDKLTTFAKQGTKVDMSAWLQYYTFDAQGELNFSKPIGFIESGHDVGGFCHMDHEMMTYFAKWGQILQVERLKTRFLSLVQVSEPNPLFEFTLNIIQERFDKPDDKRDFLSKLIQIHKNDPEKLSLREVIAGVYINIVTGHDVTAIQMRAMVYYVAKSPSTYRKLRFEIAEAEKEGKLSKPALYSEAASLTFLSATIMETLRIHPSAGLTLERVAPLGGMVLHEKHIPQGTIVGVNAWVINRNPQIFGEDAGEFRPERWIENTPEKIQLMRKNLFTWSTGARSCIGKNMATLQLYKIMVALYRNFDIELAEPEKDWDVVGGWLTRQTKMDMILRQR